MEDLPSGLGDRGRYPAKTNAKTIHLNPVLAHPIFRDMRYNLRNTELSCWLGNRDCHGAAYSEMYDLCVR